MQLIVQGKNVEVTDWLRQYVEKRVARLNRRLPEIKEARVELSLQNARSADDRHVVQVTLRSNGAILRAEERSADMQTSIDTVMDKMVRQIDRYKGRRLRGRVHAVVPAAGVEAEAVEPEAGQIVRVKRFPVTAMAPDEAIDQMELLGHDFFIFFNADSDTLNVLYRRHDGNYGLLEPEA
ncbi:MAG TPA: ribosome-associated translation inhibitor RaiA [Anaerolineae bacterium]|nr:ribosome-associated translation inhibitor RaiA [Anaerolineae bacterium]HOR01614.1 ribosome-associated translation inhibitor RaiA [Anaerolineae bacterium]